MEEVEADPEGARAADRLHTVHLNTPIAKHELIAKRDKAMEEQYAFLRLLRFK